MLLTVCVLWKHKYVFIKLCLSQEECAWYHLNIKLTGAVSHTPTPDQEGMEMFDLLISQEQRLCCEVWCRHTFPQLSHYKRISCKSVINIFYPVTYIYIPITLFVFGFDPFSPRKLKTSPKKEAHQKIISVLFMWEPAGSQPAEPEEGSVCVLHGPRNEETQKIFWRMPSVTDSYCK